VAKVRETLTVSKEATPKFDMERFNFKKSDEVEGKEQYRVEISNRYAALEHLDNDVNIYRAWETIRKNIKISAKEGLGYYELKKHKPGSGNSKFCSFYTSSSLHLSTQAHGSYLFYHSFNQYFIYTYLPLCAPGYYFIKVIVNYCTYT
jgi:hypothetical protein